MDHLRTWWRPTLGIAILILLIAVGYWYTTRIYVAPFPLASGDHITSWNFKGGATGNPTLEAEALARIKANEAIIAATSSNPYFLYNLVGNDYIVIGDGKKAYDAYNHAVKAGPNEGLTYANMGNLMSLLGAYGTARDAFKKSVEVQPSIMPFHLVRLQFLTEHFKNDSATVAAAFIDAGKQFGDAAPILVLEAPWLEGQGRIADAIKAWQTARILSPRDHWPAIDSEIERLKSISHP